MAFSNNHHMEAAATLVALHLVLDTQECPNRVCLLNNLTEVDIRECRNKECLSLNLACLSIIKVHQCNSLVVILNNKATPRNQATLHSLAIRKATLVLDKSK